MPSPADTERIVAAGLRWRVRVEGSGPVLLLLHGTGASIHSWRGLLPLLTPQFTVCAPDLPGHAETDPLPSGRLSLPGMAAAVSDLLDALHLEPSCAVGHSAGAAILARMMLDDRIRPASWVSLNGALLPLHGLAGLSFKPLARLMVASTLPARLFAARARDPVAIRRLIASTGSRLDGEGIEGYARLVRDPNHVANVLAMMAAWDLAPLARQLSGLKPRTLLVVGGNDRTVPPSHADRVRRLLPGAEKCILPGLGHLAHEEAPHEVARLIGDWCRDAACSGQMP